MAFNHVSSLKRHGTVVGGKFLWPVGQMPFAFSSPPTGQDFSSSAHE
jgi:hypothetical protein